MKDIEIRETTRFAVYCRPSGYKKKRETDLVGDLISAVISINVLGMFAGYAMLRYFNGENNGESMI
jgi:hypothetical protein